MKYKIIEFSEIENIYQIKETFNSNKLNTILWLVRRLKGGKKFETIIDLNSGLIIWSFYLIDWNKIEQSIVLNCELRGMNYELENQKAKEKHGNITIK